MFFVKKLAKIIDIFVSQKVNKTKKRLLFLLSTNFNLQVLITKTTCKFLNKPAS
jgi:hypothetical protein